MPTLDHPMPNRPLSRLERKHFHRLNNADDRGEHDNLAKELGHLNGMEVTECDFPLSKLLPPPATKSGRRPAWGEYGKWPGFDHVVFFRRGRKRVAALSQPYDAPDVERLRAYAAEKGLLLHTPPNPFASFWYPGWTYCLLITGPDFGEVQWLSDQLNFTAHGPVT